LGGHALAGRRRRHVSVCLRMADGRFPLQCKAKLLTRGRSTLLAAAEQARRQGVVQGARPTLSGCVEAI